MKVIHYDNKRITYYCEHCNIYGEYDLRSVLSDNCALKIDVICDHCNANKDIYILICYDQSIAPVLQAKFAVLKERSE